MPVIQLEAHKIVEVLGKTTLVKIPCIPEGFKAMKQLKKEGIRFIGTAIYTAMQGFQVRRGVCCSLCEPYRQHGL